MSGPDAMPAADAVHRDFAGRRVLLSALRVLHMVGLAGFAGALLGHAGHAGTWGLVMAASGLAIIGLDRWSDPTYLRQVKGVSALLKLVLAVVLVTVEPLRLPLFWAMIVFSVAMAHAPGSIRHRRVL